MGSDLHSSVGHDMTDLQRQAGCERIPPERYERWANALRLGPTELVCRIMRFYAPMSYRLLFGDSLPLEMVACVASGKLGAVLGDGVQGQIRGEGRRQN